MQLSVTVCKLAHNLPHHIMSKINQQKWQQVLEYYDPIGGESKQDHELYQVFEATKRRIYELGPISFYLLGQFSRHERMDKDLNEVADILQGAISEGIETLHAGMQQTLDVACDEPKNV